MGKKVDKNKLEYGNHPPEWITSKEIAYIEEIGEIIRFFVVNSPCKGISARGMTFEEYGWSSLEELMLFHVIPSLNCCSPL